LLRYGKFLAALLSLAVIGCGPSTVTRRSMMDDVQLYSSRAAFAWQNTGTFQLRGSARLEGASLVARGPFVLWADPDNSLIRGDFYGPDGKPVVSVKGDSAGVAVYLPQEEYASFSPRGMRAGGGTLPVTDLIFLLRTGFPLLMEQWQITDLVQFSEDGMQWRFSAGEDHRMVLSMEPDALFPSGCSWGSGNFTIEAASPHDEYRAWPWRWKLLINDNEVELELTDITITEVPSPGIWSLFVPVGVDTLDEVPLWQPSDTLMIR